MSSNVGLSTPRGSGTSGYVQRNWAFLKPRNAGYGAPYPPTAAKKSDSESGLGLGGPKPFDQRQPDQKILEHDRRRAVEVKVFEERERLEGLLEEQEQEQEQKKGQQRDGNGDDNKEKGGDEKKKDIITEEEIEERCDNLRQKLMKELEDAEDAKKRGGSSGSGFGSGYGPSRRHGGMSPPPSLRGHKEKRQFKSYQVHELAEAKIEESERLRRALGISEDWERERDERGA